MSRMKRALEDGIPVKVYLNRNERDSFIYGYKEGHPLELAVEYQAPLDESKTLTQDVQGILNLAFRELNIDFPTTDWANEYRAKGMRSLSVGDVVVVGELAYACDRVGWKCVSFSTGDVTL